MAKLTLQQFDAEHVLLNATEHETLTEALREYEGWAKQGSVEYLVQGTMSVQCACKRILESRNRTIQVHVQRQRRTPDGERADSYAGALLALKAPQAVTVLTALHADDDTVEVTITNSMFQVL